MRRHTYNIRDILNAVSSVTDIPVLQIIGDSREHQLVALRWVAIRIAREDGYSLSEIGKAVGGRDHSTILAGVISAGEHIKASSVKGRYMLGVERQVKAHLSGGEWCKAVEPLDPTSRRDKAEKPPPNPAPDALAAMRFARIMSASEAPKVVTKAGYINSVGEIVLWGD